MLPKLQPQNSPSPRRTIQRSSASPASLHIASLHRRSLNRKWEDRSAFLVERSCEANDPSPKLTRLSCKPTPKLMTCKSLNIKRNTSFISVRESGIARHIRLEGILSQYAELKEARLQRERKRLLCKALEKLYELSLPYIEMCSLTETEILAHAQALWKEQLARKAIGRLKQSCVQKLALRNIKAVNARHHIAAFTIQLYWRKYKVLNKQVNVLAFKQQLALHNKAAIKIQKVYRGYR